MGYAVYYNENGLKGAAVVATSDGKVAVVPEVKDKPDYAPFFKSEGFIYPSPELQQLLQKDGLIPAGPAGKGLIVGVILKFEAIPGSNLNKCFVHLGDRWVQIVCGATNVLSGNRAVVALPGTFLPNGSLIEETTIMGEQSAGMLCSDAELGFTPKAPKTIAVLDKTLAAGSPYLDAYAR